MQLKMNIISGMPSKTNNTASTLVKTNKKCIQSYFIPINNHCKSVVFSSVSLVISGKTEMKLQGATLRKVNTLT
jgi:hypothetical protein